MTKQEFISVLQKSLGGKVSSLEIVSQTDYYNEYIETQIRLGRAEEDVLLELGDPRLIAKSIIAAMGSASDEMKPGKEEETGQRKSFFKITGWRPLLVIAVFLLCIFMIFAFVLSLLPIVLPIVIPVAAILFIIRWYQSK